LLSIAAAAAYTVGGVFMKQSEGLTRLIPALMVFACFVAGSAAQSVSMRESEMSRNYIIVLGLEAALALGLGMLLFGERLSAAKAAGVLLVAAGVGILRMP
jgi:small multidrug resistance pump/quaternary ammonium compound-resistance protein SugE